MRKKTLQILELFAKGMSRAAIANLLDCDIKAVRAALGAPPRAPEGYISIQEAARRIGMEQITLRHAMERGDLRARWIGHFRYVRPGDVKFWMANHPYRQAAKQVLERLRQHLPKPSQ